jgi:hypothetical protein
MKSFHVVFNLTFRYIAMFYLIICFIHTLIQYTSIPLHISLYFPLTTSPSLPFPTYFPLPPLYLLTSSLRLSTYLPTRCSIPSLYLSASLPPPTYVPLLTSPNLSLSAYLSTSLYHLPLPTSYLYLSLASPPAPTYQYHH